MIIAISLMLAQFEYVTDISLIENSKESIKHYIEESLKVHANPDEYQFFKVDDAENEHSYLNDLLDGSIGQFYVLEWMRDNVDFKINVDTNGDYGL